ncbi:hypothetical protein AVEN_261610-1 [Araneus ventricosus]|uniref:Uncharacterized protein n=1 Tax=Araneus ventricosus TaxID=182803 RepID=A0A4Y2SIU2_ARAVE|nr:hypothetical protein AVEN_261610-1 [Araneus ventricosus]
MSRLDESRWKKHGERYAAAITDDRGNASRLRSSMHDQEQLLFAARVDIDVYDASGNIAGKSEFPMLRKKRQYKHRNGDDCITSIFSDASKIGTVLVNSLKSFTPSRHSFLYGSYMGASPILLVRYSITGISCHITL